MPFFLKGTFRVFLKLFLSNQFLTFRFNNDDDYQTISYQNIFNTSRISQYFVNQPDLEQPYIEAASVLNKLQCSNVGTVIAGDWEYPIWVLLQNNQIKNYRIESVNVTNKSSIKYHIHPYNDFYPCAVISVNSASIDDTKNNYIKALSQKKVSVFVRKE